MVPFRHALTFLVALTREFCLFLRNILPCAFSDHCAVSLSVDVPHTVHLGPGRWKLNISLLEDEEYVSLISSLLVDWHRCQNHFSSPVKWWEECKARIKGLSINYGVPKSKRTLLQRDLLVRLADHLKSKLHGGNSSSSFFESFSELVVPGEALAVFRSYIQVSWQKPLANRSFTRLAIVCL